MFSSNQVKIVRHLCLSLANIRRSDSGGLIRTFFSIHPLAAENGPRILRIFIRLRTRPILMRTKGSRTVMIILAIRLLVDLAVSCTVLLRGRKVDGESQNKGEEGGGNADHVVEVRYRLRMGKRVESGSTGSIYLFGVSSRQGQRKRDELATPRGLRWSLVGFGTSAMQRVSTFFQLWVLLDRDFQLSGGCDRLIAEWGICYY